MTRPATRIGIAVVRHAGRYLVGVRAPQGSLPGLAEFPGGKCGPGESDAACACRECLEETGLEVLPVRPLLSRTFEYPHAVVDLRFWLCRPTRPDEVAEDHCGFRWVAASELPALSFPEANRPLIARLAADGASDP